MWSRSMQLLKMVLLVSVAVPGVAQQAAAATWTQFIPFSGSAGLLCTTESCSDSGVGGSVELGRFFDRRLGKLDAVEITITPVYLPHYAAIALYARWEEPGWLYYSIGARWDSTVLTASRSLGGGGGASERLEGVSYGSSNTIGNFVAFSEDFNYQVSTSRYEGEDLDTLRVQSNYWVEAEFGGITDETIFEARIETGYASYGFVDFIYTPQDALVVPVPPALPLFATVLGGLVVGAWRRATLSI